MKLGQVFSSKASRWRGALACGDLDTLEKLIGVPQHDLRWEAVRSATYRGISRETASFLIEKITEDKATAWWRNSFSPRKQHDMHEAILKGAVLGGGQAGLLDVFIDSAARRKEVLDALLKATDDEAQRVAHMQSLLASPRTTPADYPALFNLCAKETFLPGIDLLAAAGYDLHANNERLLREAAAEGQAEVCRHLVAAHGADIRLAITTERTIGNEKKWRFLDGLRAEMAPEDAPPPTMAEMAAELHDLQQMVAELQGGMRKMAAELAALKAPAADIDKPALRPARNMVPS